MIYKYKVSICAIFQNEAIFLREWIEFHRLVGVDHFYLINDRSQDQYLEILRPYIQKGLVDLFECQVTMCQDLGLHLNKQVQEYNRLLPQIQLESKWVIAMDLDEFFYCVDKTDIREFVDRYSEKEIGAIYIFWQMFGTSHLTEIPPDQLLIESLTSCAEEQYAYNKYGKSLIKTSHCLQLGIQFF